MKVIAQRSLIDRSLLPLLSLSVSGTSFNNQDKAASWSTMKVLTTAHGKRCNQVTDTNIAMADGDLVLVYHHRHRDFIGEKLIEGGLGLVPRATLDQWLKKSKSGKCSTDHYANTLADPDFQATVKTLTNKNVTIYRRDLRREEQREGDSGVTLDQNVASVEVRNRHWYFGRYRTLVIISQVHP